MFDTWQRKQAFPFVLEHLALYVLKMVSATYSSARLHGYDRVLFLVIWHILHPPPDQPWKQHSRTWAQYAKVKIDQLD